MSIAIEDTKAGAEAETDKSGYVDAFYAIADILGIPSPQPLSPKRVFEEQMLPKLKARAADEIERLQAALREACLATHRQAACIHYCAAHIGPDTAATIDGLPRAVKALVARAEAAEAELARLQALPPLHERIVPAQGDEFGETGWAAGWNAGYRDGYSDARAAIANPTTEEH